MISYRFDNRQTLIIRRAETKARVTGREAANLKKVKKKIEHGELFTSIFARLFFCMFPTMM